MSAWSDYVQRHAKGLTQMQVADKTGLAQTAISRWLRGDTNAPRAEYVVAFARGFDQNPVEALIVAGYITAEEAGATTEVRTPISEYSGVELIDELRRKWPKHKNSPQSED
jgi:transcriptional regulator with XRE-family HTH domain